LVICEVVVTGVEIPIYHSVAHFSRSSTTIVLNWKTYIQCCCCLDLFIYI